MKFLIVTCIFIGIATSLSAQKERSLIRKGNTLFSDSDYINSEIAYKKAIDKLKPGKKSFEAEFNLGDAYFKQKKYDDALKQFKGIDDEGLSKKEKSILNHNLGNSYMAKKDLDNAINAYKTALKNNPLDDETRYNLIAAMKMKQDQKKNQKKNQNKDQNKKNQDKNKDNKDKQKQDQKKQDQNKQNQNKQQQDKKQQSKSQQQQNKISKQEAQRILESLSQDEKALQKKLRKIKDNPPTNIEKNW